MSQWGATRYFLLDGGRVCVLSHVRTDGFEQATPEHLIDGLHLADLTGDSAAAATLLRDLEKRFCGQPYGSWLKERAIARAADGGAP